MIQVAVSQSPLKKEKEAFNFISFVCLALFMFDDSYLVLASIMCFYWLCLFAFTGTFWYAINICETTSNSSYNYYVTILSLAVTHSQMRDFS